MNLHHASEMRPQENDCPCSFVRNSPYSGLECLILGDGRFGTFHKCKHYLAFSSCVLTLQPLDILMEYIRPPPRSAGMRAITSPYGAGLL